MKIEVDAITLEEKSNGIKVLNSQLKANIEEIETLILSINGSWQGDAERAYSAQIIAVKNEFNNIFSFFEDYSMLLSGIADQYNAHDEQLSSKINLA